MWHEELAELKESTYRKLRSNVFLMLREAGLLSDNGRINPVSADRPTRRRARQPHRRATFVSSRRTSGGPEGSGDDAERI